MVARAASGLGLLQERLGYTFSDQSRLEEALVHTSYVNERPRLGLVSNERLEFLGDAVLGCVVAHRLFQERPTSSEGELTVLRAWLVRESTLARWARQLELGPHVHLGRGEISAGGRERSPLLARAFEAVVGAVYLDAGLEAAEHVLRPFIDADLARGYTPERVVDAKSRLQQVCQQRFNSIPVYTLTEQVGPGHNPHFTFDVQAGPNIVASGSGTSKQAAQQAAAHAALQRLEVVQRYELPDQEYQEGPEDHEDRQ